MNTLPALTDAQQSAQLTAQIGSVVSYNELSADDAITTMEKELSGLKIVSINDKEGYNAVQKGITLVVRTRTAIDKKRKELNKLTKDAIDKAADDYTKRIVAIETNLKAEKDRIDGIIKEEKEKEEKAKAIRFTERVDSLKLHGCNFDGFNYTIGLVSAKPESIREWTNDDFDSFLEQVKSEQTMLLEAEKKKRDEDERLRADAAKAAEIEAENKRLREQLAAMQAAQAAKEAPMPEPAPLPNAAAVADLTAALGLEPIQPQPIQLQEQQQQQLTETKSQPAQSTQTEAKPFDWSAPSAQRQVSQAPRTPYEEGFRDAKAAIWVFVNRGEKFTLVDLKEFIKTLNPTRK